MGEGHDFGEFIQYLARYWIYFNIYYACIAVMCFCLIQRAPIIPTVPDRTSYTVLE
jgi:uncharacterized membrane protein